MEAQTFSLLLGNKEITVSVGKLAQQTNGSVIVSVGGTTILATAVMSKAPREGIDFFPLMVNYQEKFYAAGMIKTNRFNKRENRPSDDKILIGRLIDRTLRPLFPKGFRNDVQVMLTTLSYDRENEHDIVAAIAASAAIVISDIPWNGPTASIRVGMINGEFVLNPTGEQREISDLDLVVSSSEKDVVMIEAGAKEISESDMLKAIAFGKDWGQKVCRFLSEVAQKVGKEKIQLPEVQKDEELAVFVKTHFTEKMHNCIFDIPGKLARFGRKDELKKEAQALALETFGEDRDLSALSGLFDKLFADIIRTSILRDNVRINGRGIDEIRPLFTEVSLFPRLHGTGLFQRGETQCLSVLTLGAPGKELLTEGIEGEAKHRYMHHYNFPPFSVGECSNRLSTGNREIGHGALAQRALEAVLPKKEEFPYVIRVVSEILSSNGSSSMAATCGSTLCLMDGGVPISAPVAGIAMGLMTDPETGVFRVLSDIQDEEDFGGDMDFKVAGTAKGITAVQMDVKIMGISEEIFTTAFEQARKGRLEILDAMIKAIPAPRENLSAYAPRLLSLQINTEKIGKVIGKGGEVIQKIIAETGCEVNIEDDGMIYIASTNEEKALEAKRWILSIVEEAEVGKLYDAKITRVEDYGAFAEILPGIQGLIHVSLISNERISDVKSVLSVGQVVRVKLLEIDDKGRLRLSIKDVKE